ncbi:class IV adenylate cyclase [Alcanivorax sp. NBRC 102028]|uniref:class IV adenylate cyclase n=1 Tax=Alcanivorax sp. NBRC 102028 TaxID=1113897 RepID=UPI000789E87F|nr:class IV adenylate cyclase [Alcanivorax sp. NBRC 102028]
MARNVEIKARVEDANVLEDQVAMFADGDPTEIYQDDTFFKCDLGRLKLRTFPSGEGELIYYQRADESGPKESFYRISKTQEPDELREVLSLAYGTVGRVQKKRMLYFLGRTRIHVDRVQTLGSFLELEVVLDEDESAENGIEEARSILSKLDVNEDQLIEGAYVDLLQTSDA